MRNRLLNVKATWLRLLASPPPTLTIWAWWAHVLFLADCQLERLFSWSPSCLVIFGCFFLLSRGFSSLCGLMTLFLCFQCPKVGNLQSSSLLFLPEWLRGSHMPGSHACSSSKGPSKMIPPGASPSSAACCRSRYRHHPPGSSSRLSYIVIDTCVIFKHMRRFCSTIHHQFIYPDSSLRVISWCCCCPFHRGGNRDTKR